MGSGASVARGVEAYILINNAGNGQAIEQWWLDQGYLIIATERENETPTNESESQQEDSENMETESNTQEYMLRHEDPYYSREEIDEMFPPAPSLPATFPLFPPNISMDDAENMGISISDADALWNRWWNTRDANISFIGIPSTRTCHRRCRRRRNSSDNRDRDDAPQDDWIASDAESAGPIHAPHPINEILSPYTDEMDEDGTFRSDLVPFTDTNSDSC